MWSAVRSASRAARAANEDAHTTTERSLVLVDGASGMGEQRMPGWHTDASWFSHRLSELLAPALDDESVTITAAMTSVLGQMRAEYELATGAPLAEDPIQRPSGAAIAARVVGDSLEVATLGDCTAVISLAGGTSIHVHDDTVTRRDDRIVDLARSRAREAGLPPREARQFVREEMLAARRQMNTSGGYWVADLSARGVPHMRRATFPLEDVRDVVLMSDGFAASLDTLGLFASGSHLVSHMRRADPAGAIAQVVDLFDSDPGWERYPRLKHVDDITVLHAAA